MNIFIVFCLILVPSLASKEYADDISQLLDDPDLILELVKRLGSEKNSPVQKRPYPDKHTQPEHQPYVPVVHSDARSCRTQQRRRTIIRTEDSKKKGALFLSFTGNITTNEECLSQCCEKKGCDLAVYENKTKHNCYLFKCHDDMTGEDYCLLDDHADYITTALTTVSSSAPQSRGSNSHSQQEEDLGASLEQVTHKPDPPKPRPTPKPTQLPHSVALGNWCRLDVSCEDPHAICFQSSCQCQLHYQQRDGVCREQCGAERVACETRGTGRLGPDCIPRSQICDGVTQCADGGDERGCPAPMVDKNLPAWPDKSEGEAPTDDFSDGTRYGYKMQNSDQHPDQSNRGTNAEEETQEMGHGDANQSEPSSDAQDKPAKVSKATVDYEEFSSDVDKELEAATVVDTKPSNVKPTLHPTKPVVAWYGEETEPQDEIQHKDSQTPSKKTRVHRVDTLLEEHSDNAKELEEASKQDKTYPRGDRPEALPRPPKSMHPEIEQASPQPNMPKAKPSQAKSGDNHQKATQSTDSVADTRQGSDGVKPHYNNQPFQARPFNRQPYGPPSLNRQPYQPQSVGRQPLRPQKVNPPADIAADYDNSYFGLGQQRPYPVQRPPLQPSWPQNSFHKYPDASGYNRPYLGYNYDYNDYDSYIPGQGPDPSRPYNGRDGPRFPTNSYGGGNPGASPPSNTHNQNGWQEKENQGKTGDSTSSEDGLHTIAQMKPLATDTDNSDAEAINLHPDESPNSQEGVDSVEKPEAVGSTDTDTDPDQASANKDNTPGSPDTKSANTDSSSSDSDSETEDKESIPTSMKPASAAPVEKVMVGKEEEVFVTKEKVIITSPTDGAQGPIVALSLGLAITLMLLVFVGCRLRNVRHRLRKGRPLHSNEADYLINGMYL